MKRLLIVLTLAVQFLTISTATPSAPRGEAPWPECLPCQR
jgi:hypothetical protein